ncbi:MAG: hypothetical protein HY303_12545 [Candidatus Wallbacteria bacterium]|nr:hypothetical protein [Candidatus Wallbacteria bacterium]
MATTDRYEDCRDRAARVMVLLMALTLSWSLFGCKKGGKGGAAMPPMMPLANAQKAAAGPAAPDPNVANATLPAQNPAPVLAAAVPVPPAPSSLTSTQPTTGTTSSTAMQPSTRPAPVSTQVSPRATGTSAGSPPTCLADPGEDPIREELRERPILLNINLHIDSTALPAMLSTSSTLALLEAALRHRSGK